MASLIFSALIRASSSWSTWAPPGIPEDEGMVVGARAEEGDAELETPDDDVFDSKFFEELEHEDSTERLSQKALSLSGLSVLDFLLPAEAADDATGEDDCLIWPDSPELDREWLDKELSESWPPLAVAAAV